MSSKPSPIFIATRGSPLALAQANAVLAQCRSAFRQLTFDIKVVKTTGDKLQTASLAGAGLPKGLFTKELEMALLSHEADLAVHSLKDLPTDLPAGLKLGAVSRRADVRDVLVRREQDVQERQKPAIENLPRGAAVATGSLRRSAQLLERRPDLKVTPIRGNVGTRLKKLADQPEIDAIVLAAAGLQRLSFEIRPDGKLVDASNPQSMLPMGLVATHLGPDEMLPCVGQAALGMEIRENDERVEGVCAVLNDCETRQCVLAERAFLKGMGGGCQIAVAAYAEVSGAEIWMRAVSFLGGRTQRGEVRGPMSEAMELGRHLAERLSTSAT